MTDTTEVTTTATTVVVPITGEVLDLADATLQQLAWAAHWFDEASNQFAAERERVARALLAQVDKTTVYTHRVGDPSADYQLEVKAASPDAGTVGFDTELLELALRDALDRDVITEDAAAGALKRQVTVTFRVPFDANIDDVAGALRDAEKAGAAVEVAGHPVRIDAVTTTRDAQKAGINRLRKLPALKADVEACEVPRTPPARKPRVTVVTREGGR